MEGEFLWVSIQNAYLCTLRVYSMYNVSQLDILKETNSFLRSDLGHTLKLSCPQSSVFQALFARSSSVLNKNLNTYKFHPVFANEHYFHFKTKTWTFFLGVEFLKI